MLIIGSDDPEGLEKMADMAGEALGAEYPLVGVPMVLEDGKWLDWMPPPGHKLRRRFREMKLRWIGSDYAEQMKLLDAPHEKTGDDAFVANFSAVEKEDEGGLVSYCVWGEGVRTLLPETDRSVLMRECGDGPAAIGDRQRVVAVAGHLVEETEDYPSRYRTHGLPDGAGIEALAMGEL